MEEFYLLLRVIGWELIAYSIWLFFNENFRVIAIPALLICYQLFTPVQPLWPDVKWMIFLILSTEYIFCMKHQKALFT